MSSSNGIRDSLNPLCEETHQRIRSSPPAHYLAAYWHTGGAYCVVTGIKLGGAESTYGQPLYLPYRHCRDGHVRTASRKKVNLLHIKYSSETSIASKAILGLCGKVW